MARIPLGNFEQATVQAPVQHSRVDNSGTLAVGRATERLGNVAADTGMRLLDQASRQRQEAAAQDDALARAKAANGLTEHDLRVRATAADINEQIRTGVIDYNKGAEAFRERATKIQAAQIPNLSPELAERYNGGLKNNALGGELLVTGAVQQAKRDDFKNQFVQAGDLLAKKAALPGADIDQINAAFEAFVPLGRAADIDAAVLSKSVQDFKDKNWTNQASQRLVMGRDNVESLQQLKADLVGDKGYYTERLDPEKRHALATSVSTRIDQLNARNEHETDKRETVAAGVVKDAIAQAASGLVPTPETLQTWLTSVSGTTQEAAFKEALGTIEEVQTIRRLPGPQQEAWLQEQETRLNTKGGSPQDKTRLNTVRAVIDKDQEQRTEAPLLYLQNMTGQPPPPLDLAGNLQSGNFDALGEALSSRMASIQTLAKGGYRVEKNLLLPNESESLTDLVNAMPVDKLNSVFGALRAGAGSDDTYNAVMRQIAPGAPLKAYAGELAVRPGGQKVSSLILRGNALLDSKEGKVKWPMPPDGKFETAFMAAAGNAYQGRPEDQQRDLLAARAVYAASAAQDGDSDAGTEFNERRFANSMQAVAGEIAQVGGIKVTVPWGVSAEDFEDRVPMPMRAALVAAGLDPDPAGVGLMATPVPGRYVLIQGRSPIWNPNSKRADGRAMPVYIDLEPQPPEPEKTGRGDRVVRHR